MRASGAEIKFKGRYTLVKKEEIADVECIKCKGLTHVSQKIVEAEKETGNISVVDVRWT